MTWYISKRLLDRPNYTAHLDPLCSHFKLKSNPRRLHLVARAGLGAHVPCKCCGGRARLMWEAAWSDYYAGNISVNEMHKRRAKIQSVM